MNRSKNNMKYINRIIAGLASVAVVAACDLNKTPEFDQADSFVAFSSSSVSVAEDGGSVTLNLGLACVKPVATTVTYSVVSGSAVEGADFSLADETGVITFDGTARSAQLTVNVVDFPGVYTGDKTFSIKLENATAVKIGADNVCTVTITDNDHPLGELFGTYTVSSSSIIYPSGVAEAVTIGKNEGDLTSVKIYNMGSTYISWVGSYPTVDNSFVGNVVKDDEGNITGLSIPVSQANSLKYGSYTCSLYGLDYREDGMYRIYDTNIVLSYKDGVFTSTNYGYFIMAISDGSIAGYIDAVNNGFTWTKQ